MKRGYEHLLKDLEKTNWQRHPQNSLERAEEGFDKGEQLRVRWELRKHHLPSSIKKDHNAAKPDS